jgi:Zn-dependent protease
LFGGPSLKLMTLFGIPIGAHWSLLLAVVLMGVAHGGPSGALLSLLVFTSVLLHELGHALVAQRRRVPIAGIDLHFFGGVAKMMAPPRSPRDEIAIAIAGPVVSLLLGVGLAALAVVLGRDAPAFLPWIAGVNMTLAVFNMLPALPMDGGRVFRAVLAKRHGLVEGTRRAVNVGRVIAVGLGVLALFTSPWMIALAVLVWSLGSAEKSQMKRHQTLRAMGFRDDEVDPWARYARAADRDRAIAPDAVLAPADRAQSLFDTVTGGTASTSQARTQRIVRDPFGRYVVVTETTTG